MKDIKTIDSLYHACTYGRAPVVFERGRGARLWDDKGRDYIDFGSGIGVMSLGYANPEWVKAVSEQAAVLPHTRSYRRAAHRRAGYRGHPAHGRLGR